MKYNVDEAVVSAIMTEVPIVFVEGHDDIQFYEKLCIDLEKEVEVFAVETFEDYGQGCDSVIKLFEYLQIQISQNPLITNYVMGIIDRDARYFRNELPENLKGLFVLKYYSFESHFVCDINIEKILPMVSSINIKAIDKEVIDFCKGNFLGISSQLYYISLEALKKACVEGYQAVLGYSTKAALIADKNSREILFNKVIEKKEDLDSFAQEKNIDETNLFSIIKGKWLLQTYANCVLERLNDLQNACSKGEIKRCQYCESGHAAKCLWKLKEKYRYNQIANLLSNYYDESEVQYIKERLNKLGSNYIEISNVEKKIV
ncbi:DUF4435 domain-containing protein [Paenibacillus polymyxa]|uniref:DUF4435 domain-containing protein n=1 Tax=Paenibacillus polymyxa TaxID=1406 RepID=UPI002AB48EA5|nr:DUF4435 domain-containing protein [Paenibacillus polymyxa]MDY8025154.1 DUF4435 domain-containing protein [Paenibacillus polymyxa]